MSRATIVTIHVKDDSRVRESVAVLRFVVAWGGPTLYPTGSGAARGATARAGWVVVRSALAGGPPQGSWALG